MAGGRSHRQATTGRSAHIHPNPHRPDVDACRIGRGLVARRGRAPAAPQHREPLNIRTHPHRPRIHLGRRQHVRLVRAKPAVILDAAPRLHPPGQLHLADPDDLRRALRTNQRRESRRPPRPPKFSLLALLGRLDVGHGDHSRITLPKVTPTTTLRTTHFADRAQALGNSISRVLDTPRSYR